ncbi:MAG: hypothetical protein AAFZ80_12335 [Cyanobacteria bacterium P01_A01_bin.105]
MMKHFVRLGTVLFLLCWLGACQPTSRREEAATPAVSSTQATASDPMAAPDVTTLDTTTQCQLGPQAAANFPDLAFELPTPPAEVGWTEASTDNLGVGYIGPVEAAVNADTPDYLLVGFANADWVKRVILPLYDQPDGTLDSWLACGWLMLGETAEQTELSLPLFFPGYSGFGMLVLAEEGDWLQLHDGVWVLRSHLTSSTVPLAYQSWSKRYQAMLAEHATYAADDPSADWGYLSAKTPETSLTLYRSPDGQSQVMGELSPATSMLPLEMQGDWMRVRAYTPSNFCIQDWQGETQEGWVRWMDSEKGGNQVAEPYKGC